MPHVAVKRLKVGHDEKTDTPIWVESGETVPGSDAWPWQLVATYERQNIMRRIDQPSEEAPPPDSKGVDKPDKTPQKPRTRNRSTGRSSGRKPPARTRKAG